MLRHFAVRKYLKMFQYVLAGLSNPVSMSDFHNRDRSREASGDLRALEQGHKKASSVKGDGIEEHDITEPLISPGGEDA
jgi:hypothetical protein